MLLVRSWLYMPRLCAGTFQATLDAAAANFTAHTSAWGLPMSVAFINATILTVIGHCLMLQPYTLTSSGASPMSGPLYLAAVHTWHCSVPEPSYLAGADTVLSWHVPARLTP